MVFDNEYRKNVCKIGQGRLCCRYLTMGPNGFECAKRTELKGLIDYKVATAQFTARGDNCEGVEVKQDEQLSDH